MKQIAYPKILYVRRGYFKLQSTYLDDDTLSKLSSSEIERYADLGKKLEDKEKKRNTILGTVVGVLVVIGILWWGYSAYQSNQEKTRKDAAEKIENSMPTPYTSKDNLLSATFPNKPSEIPNNPDAESNPKVLQHNEIISGSNDEGLYVIDVITFSPKFDELDCIQFLGDTVNHETNFTALDLLKLRDGRPTLNYIHLKNQTDDPIYLRAAVVTTRDTNRCYRIGIAGNPVATEKQFKKFLDTIIITEP